MRISLPNLARTLLAFSLLTVCQGAGGARAQTRAGRDKVAPDLRERLRRDGEGARADVIVQFGESGGRLAPSLLTGLGARLLGRFARLGASAVNLPLSSVESLAARADVRYVSPDRPVMNSGHLTTTIGAEAVRYQTITSLFGLVSTTTTTDGSGVAVAVVDSGVDAAHSSLAADSGASRVVYSQDFTGEGRTDDPYGHGTHVAGIAAGSGRASNGSYTGVAPGAKIVNLRVLNAEGVGSTAALLGALDWLLTNHSAYNVRVVNLSLGARAVDSHADDPVCVAVRKLVDAGVVVVAAAGNNGRDGAGQKLYGQIHSPGDEPSAVTVGATNTFGTDSRADEQMTTYSSRGPTRGSWADAAGVRHYDNFVKPDLVAPGNRIVSAAAPGNRILAAHPELAAGAPGGGMMYLSGTSMAAPVVAGAAALVLQANPKLTPNLVKALLMLTAQPLPGFNHFEQGAGALNVEGAVRLARLARKDLTNSTSLGAPLLTTSAPAPQSSFAGTTFAWSQGLVLDHTYAAGADLFGKYQKIYGAGLLLGDGVSEGAQTQAVDPSMMTAGVVVGDALLTCDGTTIGGGLNFLQAGLLLGDGIIMGDGIVMGDGVIMGDGIVMGDAQSGAFGGDPTAAMR